MLGYTETVLTSEIIQELKVCLHLLFTDSFLM